MSKKTKIARRITALLLSVFMLAALLFALAGCGGNDVALTTPNLNSGTKTEDTTSETTTETTAETTTEETTTEETTTEETKTEETTAEETTTEETTTEETTTEETTTEDTTEETSEETTEETSESLPVGDGVTILSGGATSYTIVIGKNSSSVISDAGNLIKKAYKDNYNLTVQMRKEDMYKLLNGGTLDGPKIVIGTLNEDETSHILEKPLYDSEYVIRVVGDTVYIIGGDDESTLAAAEKFISLYMPANKTEIKLNDGILYNKESLPQIENMTIAGNKITEYVIVYYNSVYGKECAERVQAAIAAKIDLTLPLVPDSTAEQDCEILVGKTSRTEAKAVRADFASPNLYYDIQVSGDKLVVMGEGYMTLDKVGDEFESWFEGLDEQSSAISGKIKSGNIKSSVDTTGALDIASGTNLRVLHFNVTAPYFSMPEEGVVLKFEDTEKGHKQRAEQIADVMLQYNPDIITTNEMYPWHTSGWLYNTVKQELSEHFTVIQNIDYDTGKPFADSAPLPNRTQAEQIFFRKGEFDIVDAGWRYLSEKTTDSVTGVTTLVDYHGITWAVLKDKATGKNFIISVGHYADSLTTTTYAKEHHDAIATAQQASGSSTTLPTILTGDMFTGNRSGSNAGYNYHKNTKGFSDSQTTAATNCNNNTKHGTFHTVNKRETNRISEDFVWYNGGKLQALKFKVIASSVTDILSDHYPVVSDLKFK